MPLHYIYLASLLWRQHWASAIQNKWPLLQRCLKWLDDKLNPSSQRVKFNLPLNEATIDEDEHFTSWYDLKMKHRYHHWEALELIEVNNWNLLVISFCVQKKSIIIKHWDLIWLNCHYTPFPSSVEWTDSKFWTQENWDQHPNFSPPPSDFITLTSSLSLSL